jgi:hypothetical protein
MNSWLALGLILGLLFVGAVSLDFALYVNNGYKPLNPFINTSDFLDNIVAENTANGLNLTVSLSSTSILQGQSMDVTVDETNVINATNIVNVSDKWPLMSQYNYTVLSAGICVSPSYPIGAAFYKGYYTASDISSAQPLEIYHPGVYSCPAEFYYQYFKFQPLSDNTTIFINEGINQNGTTVWSNMPYATEPMNVGIATNGYWTYSLSDLIETNAANAVFHTFDPGIYTIAGGDEWGQLVILHFVVT